MLHTIRQVYEPDAATENHEAALVEPGIPPTLATEEVGRPGRLFPLRRSVE